MISLSQIEYASLVRRHGRSRRDFEYQRKSLARSDRARSVSTVGMPSRRIAAAVSHTCRPERLHT
jgi:hypothetical protein